MTKLEAIKARLATSATCGKWTMSLQGDNVKPIWATLTHAPADLEALVKVAEAAIKAAHPWRAHVASFSGMAERLNGAEAAALRAALAPLLEPEEGT